MSNDLYVWYSAATDVTGRRLMEALECEGGTGKPAADKTVICWGTKTKEAIKLSNKAVFNHPNSIRVNRNKLTALEKFQEAECNVAPFTANFDAAGTGQFEFPLIARTKYHQGGKGFWFCPVASHLTNAREEGAQYLQKYIDIRDEYRLHVVGDKVVYAVKKVRRTNHREAFESDWKEQIQNKAEKDGMNLDEDTLNFALQRLSRKQATGTDMIVRSNTRGWKFSRVNLNNLNNDLAAEAIKAVAAVGLNYGAVDCCIDTDGTPWVIECNTGPGLEGSSLEAWVAALKDLVKSLTKKTAAKASASKAGASTANLSLRERMKLKAELMSEMIEAASDDAELSTLENLFGKMAE